MRFRAVRALLLWYWKVLYACCSQPQVCLTADNTNRTIKHVNNTRPEEPITAGLIYTVFLRVFENKYQFK